MTLAPGMAADNLERQSAKHIVDALRALFRGHVVKGTVGIGGVAVGVAVILLGMTFGARALQRDSA